MQFTFMEKMKFWKNNYIKKKKKKKISLFIKWASYMCVSIYIYLEKDLSLLYIYIYIYIYESKYGLKSDSMKAAEKHNPR